MFQKNASINLPAYDVARNFFVFDEDGVSTHHFFCSLNPRLEVTDPALHVLTKIHTTFF